MIKLVNQRPKFAITQDVQLRVAGEVVQLDEGEAISLRRDGAGYLHIGNPPGQILTIRKEMDIRTFLRSVAPASFKVEDGDDGLSVYPEIEQGVSAEEKLERMPFEESISEESLLVVSVSH
jgi:hypothetical protein